MIDPISAVIGGASVVSGFLGQRNQRKQAQKANELSARQRAETLEMIRRATEDANRMLPIGYEESQNIRNQLMGNLTGLQSNMLGPQMDFIREGSLMGQGTLLAGLGEANKAIMGGRFDPNALQAQVPSYDVNALRQSLAMPGLNTTPINEMVAAGQRPTPAPGYNPNNTSSDNILNAMRLAGYA